MTASIPVIQEKVRLRTKRDVLRLFLYTKLTEKGVPFSESELDVLMELYELGGYYDIDKEREFFHNCIIGKYRTSDQSVRNVLTKFVNYGVIKKPRIHQRFICHDYLPPLDTEQIGLMFFVSHAA